MIEKLPVNKNKKSQTTVIKIIFEHILPDSFFHAKSSQNTKILNFNNQNWPWNVVSPWQPLNVITKLQELLKNNLLAMETKKVTPYLLVFYERHHLQLYNFDHYLIYYADTICMITKRYRVNYLINHLRTVYQNI